MPRSFAGDKYVVCNTDEGEPGTFKDRDIIVQPAPAHRGHDHRRLHAGRKAGYNYIHGEIFEEYESWEKGLEEARAAGLLGKNILRFRLGFRSACASRLRRLHLRRGNRVAGIHRRQEGAAALQAAVPGQLWPLWQADHHQQHRNPGLDPLDHAPRRPGLPGTGQAEQRRQQDLLDLRPRQQTGQLRDSPGHAVRRPAGDGRRRAHRPQAEGGDSRRLVRPGPAGRRHDGLHLDFDSISKAGSMLGSGAVIVMDDSVCMVKALERLSYFYFEESCGQCTPCREGTGWLYRIVQRIEHGRGRPEDLDELLRIGKNIAGNTICALGEAAVGPVPAS
jgi:NADH-quinone oxidoreductase subunit F